MVLLVVNQGVCPFFWGGGFGLRIVECPAGVLIRTRPQRSVSLAWSLLVRVCPLFGFGQGIGECPHVRVNQTSLGRCLYWVFVKRGALFSALTLKQGSAPWASKSSTPSKSTPLVCSFLGYSRVGGLCSVLPLNRGVPILACQVTQRVWPLFWKLEKLPFDLYLKGTFHISFRGERDVVKVFIFKVFKSSTAVVLVLVFRPYYTVDKTACIKIK